MPRPTTEDFKSYLDYCWENRELLAKVKRAGCFSCRSLIRVRDIRDWTDNGRTALCPRCEIDAIIPSGQGFKINKKLLGILHKYAFKEIKK